MARLRWPRRNRLPQEVKARLHTAPGERVLAHAPAEEGTAVATTRALHLPGGASVPWEDIDSARWESDGLVLVEADGTKHLIALAAPGPLAEAVFDRVNATILVSHYVTLTEDAEGTKGLRLIARRPPGGDEVTWRVRYDDGVDPADPAVRDHAQRWLALLREQTGV
ncbi:hypothetical protein [Salinactinospora qingdaonensis]|uniref:Polyketide cyclase / dehydrase and lipid transport n=1 Tax=Salinactinospora qingdaonensis TaxID=702744 RepID=A0ABP7FY96_9ACTN